MTAPWRSLWLAALVIGPLAMADPGTANAVESDTAYAAYQTGHYRRAQTEALKRIEADNTDAAAMTLLGEIYRLGLGVAPNRRTATEWYERAAQRGDINGLYAWAMALLDPRNGTPAPARAGAMLERAAAAGHAGANYNLALTLLATGRTQDDARAVACLEIAARAGTGDAMQALGILARQGRGMARSDARAAEWMAQAAQAGNVAGMIEYAVMLFNGTGVATDETAAAKLFLRAAGKGNPVAQNRIARLYQTGRGIAPDSIEAAGWHLAARAQGVGDPALELLFDRLDPEQQGRAATLAATRIEGAALTAPSQTSK